MVGAVAKAIVPTGDEAVGSSIFAFAIPLKPTSLAKDWMKALGFFSSALSALSPRLLSSPRVRVGAFWKVRTDCPFVV